MRSFPDATQEDLVHVDAASKGMDRLYFYVCTSERSRSNHVGFAAEITQTGLLCEFGCCLLREKGDR